MPSTCVLTVGSTRFDPLVASFLDPTSLSSLSSLGIQHVLAQVGNSSLPEGWKEGTRMTEQGLQVEVVRFLGDLEERVGRADLVVSHAGASRCASRCVVMFVLTRNASMTCLGAGAGSILSFLRPLNSSSPSSSAERTRRQLVLIPNSTLMDSHQSDLADEMEKKGWAVVCRRPECVASYSMPLFCPVASHVKANSFAMSYRDLPATLKQLASRAEQQGEMPAPDYPELYKGRMQRIIDETLGYV